MRLRTQALIIAAVAVVVLGTTTVLTLILASGPADTAAVATVTSASPTPSPVDYDREACRKVQAISGGIMAVFDSDVMSPVAAAASLASDPEIKAAGLALTPLLAYDGPQPGPDSVEAARLATELMITCRARYGEAP